MLHLLNIEWLKLKNYRTFWILIRTVPYQYIWDQLYRLQDTGKYLQCQRGQRNG